MFQSTIIVSVATEVEASCDDVWKVISDIENAPSVVTQVQSIERLSNDKGCFHEGTRWRELRKCGGDMIQIKTVTCIRYEDGGGKSVAINVSYPHEKNEITNTCTLTVRPLDGDKEKKCLLIGSFGAMAGGVKWRIYFFFRSRYLVKLGRKFMLEELEEIGMEAVKQSQKQ